MNPFNTYCSQIAEYIRLSAFTHSLITDNIQFTVLRRKKSNKISLITRSTKSKFGYTVVDITVEGYDKIVLTHVLRGIAYSLNKQKYEFKLGTQYNEEKIKEIVNVILEAETAKLE